MGVLCVNIIDHISLWSLGLISLVLDFGWFLSFGINIRILSNNRCGEERHRNIDEIARAYAELWSGRGSKKSLRHYFIKS